MKYADYTDYNSRAAYGVAWGTICRKARELMKGGVPKEAAFKQACNFYKAKR